MENVEVAAVPFEQLVSRCCPACGVSIGTRCRITTADLVEPEPGDPFAERLGEPMDGMVHPERADAP